MNYDLINLSETDAKSLLSELKNQIQIYNKSYYQDNISLVSDAEYDQLLGTIAVIEAKFPNLTSDESPTQKVGYFAIDSFMKIAHKVPMLSLANAFSKEDLEDFLARIQNFLRLASHMPEICCELKIDGVSFSARYEGGKLVSASSRGDGMVGEDITHNVLTIKNLPHTLKDVPKILEVRGEVYIDKADLEELNKEQSALNKQIFANPRNAASGSLRQLDPNITAMRPLKYFVYALGEVEGLEVPSKQSELLEYFETKGFCVNPQKRCAKTQDEILDFYANALQLRDKLPYEIDGVVYKVDDFELQKRLGFVARAPRFAIAHKFPAIIGSTRLNAITVQVGRTGALTPVAELEPISIGGVIVSRASLHNIQEIERKDVRVGDMVFLQRAGDVIPQILNVDLSKRANDAEAFIFPKTCPSCCAPIFAYEDEAIARCENGLACPAQNYERLVHFVSRGGLDIDGFGKQQIAFLLEEKLISDPLSIFTFLNIEVEAYLSAKHGWGIKSVLNLKEAIKNSQKTTLPKFIYALGIRHIGESNARLLAQELGSAKELLNFLHAMREGRLETIEKLNNLPGIGEKIIEMVREFCLLEHNIELVKGLVEILEIEDFKQVIVESAIVGKVIVFTGSLESMSRPEAKEIAEKLGAKVAAAVSKNVDIVVAGSDAGSKLKKAHDLGVRVMTEEMWVEISKQL